MTAYQKLAGGLAAAAVAVLCAALVETTQHTGSTDPKVRLDCLNNAFRAGGNPDLVCPR